MGDAAEDLEFDEEIEQIMFIEHLQGRCNPQDCIYCEQEPGNVKR